MPPTPRSDEFVVPAQIALPHLARELHFHTPSTGGEIAFNNLQLIQTVNSWLRELEKTVIPEIRDNDSSKTHLPFFAIPPYPTQGYNIHHHTGPFDGGNIFGGGLHDHRSNAHGGFAYAVYHPGTNLPSLAYEEEQVNEI